MSSPAAATFVEYADSARPAVDRALEDYTAAAAGFPDGLRDAIRHSLIAPGKRLRPLMVLMAAEACGSPPEAAMPAACAVEMIHTYSLIHDDLPAMDDDDMRRGRPSCHAKFGEATAILAGDALLAQAFEVLGRDIQPADAAARCCAELGRAAGRAALVGGQHDDLHAEGSDGDVEQLEAIHARKTGALFRVSLRMGGIVAQAEAAQIAALDRYGQKLGLAFQVIDDLLDLHGDEQTLGKRTNKDSERGKLTYPALLGVEPSRRKAGELIAEAIDSVRIFESDASRLEALAVFVLERNR
ncbi:MAG: polyprenyl synthetase family protein [Pirellulaceae bacterium]|jgi:geranylgeranyl diphosphate synthase type II|nr:polyprenyl synthetase family protein [Pirellulaceae bacterium]MDP7019670.1 polyprenyl synthetase family protein [Pirellulaceae bacterium]